MKQCRRCKTARPLTDFHKDSHANDGLQSRCRVCATEYRRANYLKNRKRENLRARAWNAANVMTIRESKKRHREKMRVLVAQHKIRPCMDCGQSYPPYVMDLDHRENKKFMLSRACHMGAAAVKAELAKCDLVCSNCHRIRTFAPRPLDETRLEAANHVGRRSPRRAGH